MANSIQKNDHEMRASISIPRLHVNSLTIILLRFSNELHNKLSARNYIKGIKNLNLFLNLYYQAIKGGVSKMLI
ncbi:MAG: hypothetical protein QXE38_05705, partial [Candidatus Methanomethylicia archaeon]